MIMIHDVNNFYFLAAEKVTLLLDVFPDGIRPVVNPPFVRSGQPAVIQRRAKDGSPREEEVHNSWHRLRDCEQTRNATSHGSLRTYSAVQISPQEVA